MKRLVLIFLVSAFHICGVASNQGHSSDILRYVDPMIGTDGIGHTFPGAVIPFGMVQLSPDQQLEGWNYCSGYHYPDSTIMGFSHTHISGPGWSDLGDILLVPTVGDLQFSPGDPKDPDSGYRSRFSHVRETASPGYYSIMLDDYNVKAELTVSERVGFHRYTFPESDKSNVIIDPVNKIFGRTLESKVEVISDNQIRGYSYSYGWGGKRTMYFVATFSKPFKKHGVFVEGKSRAGIDTAKGEDAKAWVRFSTSEDEQIEVKVAISPVSFEGAMKNYMAEGESSSFFRQFQEAKKKWRAELKKIDIKKASEEEKIKIYTGLYHSFIHPNLFMDVDGRYVADGEVFEAGDFINHSIFSLWDTFRAVHPLFNILQREQNAHMVNSLLARYENGITMPMWELYGYDNTCMIGYHSASVIWEAIKKDIDGIDPEFALQAMIDASVANKPLTMFSSDGPPATHLYIEHGYVPAVTVRSVSKTLEYSYIDWCISQLASQVGEKEAAKTYQERSKGFTHHFNDTTKTFLPKYQPWNWVNVDPSSWQDLQKHYISGNMWAYEFFVPHDVETLISLKGGKAGFANDLDDVFEGKLSARGEQHVDISGFIGKYAHGDEPGHHMPYLFNYVDEHHRTCEIVSRIKNEMYSTAPDGLVNNDDLGQMSAWYVFSALGFYPVNPGSGNYDIGTPSVEEAVLQLENGNKFKIVTHNLSDENIYVESIHLNNKKLDRLYITHNEIMQGGVLEFFMSSEY